jgi:hypothetical protein
LFIACRKKQGELLRKAKVEAQSMRQTEVLTALTTFEKTRSAVLTAANAEQWAVNPNVHFNQWMNLTPEEFKPVVEKFAAVCKLFQCSTCCSILYVVREGASASIHRCSCGATTWNVGTR